MEPAKNTCTIRYLDDYHAALPATSQPVLKGVEDLITKGLLWKGESQAVENLWKTTPHPQYNSANESIPFNVPYIDSLLPAGGLSCGSLHEFYYHDPSRNVQTAVAIPTILARNAIEAYDDSPLSAWDRVKAREHSGAPPFFVAWIGKHSWPTPFAIPQHLLSSCLFIDPPNDTLTLWAIETALRSPLIKLVIASCPRIPLKTTRRLSLRARATGATAILLRSPSDIAMPSSSATKWSLKPLPSSDLSPQWDLTLERLKGGSIPNASWTIALENDYEHRETLSMRVLPRVVDTNHEESSTFARFG